MPSRGGDFHRALDVLLALDVGKIGIAKIVGAQLRRRHGLYKKLAPQMRYQLRDV